MHCSITGEHKTNCPQAAKRLPTQHSNLL